MEDTLINQNQLRYSGVVVNDNPFDNEKELLISNTFDGLFVPLKSEGTVIYFQSRTPSQQELQDCKHFVVTSDAIWYPREVRLGAVTANHGNELCVVESFVCKDLRMLSTLSCVYDPYMFGKSICQVAQIDVPKLKTFVSGKRHLSVSPEDLSERWNIGLRQARDTFHVTTQKYVRSAILPLSRRYRSDRHFYRKHLNEEFAAEPLLCCGTQVEETSGAVSGHYTTVNCCYCCGDNG
jgi:hypothetical protein